MNPESSNAQVRVENLLDEAYRALDEDRDTNAAKLAREGLSLLDRAGVADRPDLVSEGWTLLALVHEARGEPELVIECCLRARHAVPDDAYAMVVEGAAHIEMWDFGKADKLFVQAGRHADFEAEAAYQRAVLAEAEGRYDDAAALFQAAASIDPETFPEPVRISEEEARILLEETLESLPGPIRDGLDNVEITVAEMPDQKQFAPDISPLVLGVYQGVTLGNRSSQSFPDRILVFKRNVERFAGDRAELLEELRLTLLHEIGHHLGFDEAGLENLDL